jgi:hypothetical protein
MRASQSTVSINHRVQRPHVQRRSAYQRYYKTIIVVSPKIASKIVLIVEIMRHIKLLYNPNSTQIAFDLHL